MNSVDNNTKEPRHFAEIVELTYVSSVQHGMRLLLVRFAGGAAVVETEAETVVCAAESSMHHWVSELAVAEAMFAA